MARPFVRAMNRAPGFRPFQSLPTWAEMIIVILIAFGSHIADSTYYVMNPGNAEAVTASDFRWLLLVELSKAGLLGAFLWMRGWTFRGLGIVSPSRRDLWHAAALVAAVILMDWAMYSIALAVRPDLELYSIIIDEGGLPLPLVLALSFVNAGFEELFVCAYIIAAWRGTDLWNAIAISSVLRLSYHLYQGPLAVAVIFPFGVLFAWYFARQKRLAPLFLAHAALDVVALMQDR